jgi:probable F420-dependent oxidoreductase
MELGIAVRSMGDQSRPEVLLPCVRAAEQAGLDHIWVQDHIAIPPDDAEGSGGRYLDPLTALAWLAAHTERIYLGTGVLILPYRPPLPTAKAIATVQELSGGRLLLGVGIGWMDAEFRALEVPRAERGRRSDETLAFFRSCFREDVVNAGGQDFLFLPRPEAPPIFVGGAGEHALQRSVAYGDGWMPMTADPKKLAPDMARLAELAAAAGRGTPETVAFAGFDPRDPARAQQQVAALHELGVSRIVAGVRYADADAFCAQLDFLGEHVLPALPR